MIIFLPEKDTVQVIDVISPVEILLQNNHTFKFKSITTFDNYYSERNNNIASKLHITEDEAFILGNLAMYFAENTIKDRQVLKIKDDLIFAKHSYKSKLLQSPFCLSDELPINQKKFQKEINFIRKSNYLIYDLDKDEYCQISPNYKGKNFLVIRKGYKPKKSYPSSKSKIKNIPTAPQILNVENVKIIVSDFTRKLVPDRGCTDNICKEILHNINIAQKSIDIAIYGYSSTWAIENAIKNAQKRGVQIRLVYDEDKNGNNIYPDTAKLVDLISENKSDKTSAQASAIMHDKFYIFDDKLVITGSANLSHTDMSGFNSNNLIIINSPIVAQFYKEEFEQMYEGKFHSDKKIIPNKKYNDMEFYFSPQDKAITNALLPLINNAKHYIYIPTFVITEKRITDALIKAKRRNVEIKVILDALSASNQYSKHTKLRTSGIDVKTENLAGKMHSKSVIIDDEYLVLGSMNFSTSGENKNDENLIVIKNMLIAKFYKEFFLYQWAKIPEKWLKFSARAEGYDSIGSCSDGIDNDYDGLVDMEDDGCKPKH